MHAMKVDAAPIVAHEAVQTKRGALWRALEATPHRFDFYRVMRLIECLWRERPRFGRAVRPVEEPVRLAQEAELDFAPAPVARFGQAEKAAAPRMGVRFFGLFGPQGPLPLHLTEFARDRERQAGDATLRSFIDIFQHRMLALLYRAWAQAQPAVDLDRPQDARFDAFVGALGGLGQTSMRNRDAVRDSAKRQHIAHLARGARSAEGLAEILSSYLAVPVRVEPFVGHWMRLRPEDCSRVGLRLNASRLGAGAVAGNLVWDRQSKFRLVIGPLSRSEYLRFLPGEPAARVIRDWVRQYVGFDFVWDVQLVHTGKQIDGMRLGGADRVGLTAWIGGAAGLSARSDLVYAPEERLSA
jgi:type VI secretion system protein ImpH